MLNNALIQVHELIVNSDINSRKYVCCNNLIVFTWVLTIMITGNASIRTVMLIIYFYYRYFTVEQLGKEKCDPVEVSLKSKDEYRVSFNW